MSEPSNCPPKLTSKIVEYFLNREFNNSNNKNIYCSTNQYSSSYYSSNKNYDYGISGLNYGNTNETAGSIAVYSLNFAQPAGDYLKFRKKLDESFVSLENVLLNRFQINGTIKVKNINFHKQVFIRCSFNSWSTYQDYYAQYVPCEYYSSSAMSSGLSSPPSSSSSLSAAFYSSNHSTYQPHHKDYDTFRFEFQLPQTVDNKKNSHIKNSSPHASIQFCICYRTGQGSETKEYWDNNFGLNYEILQYVINLENLTINNSNNRHHHQRYKPQQQPTYFKYDSSSYHNLLSTQNQYSSIYY